MGLLREVRLVKQADDESQHTVSTQSANSQRAIAGQMIQPCSSQTRLRSEEEETTGSPLDSQQCYWQPPLLLQITNMFSHEPPVPSTALESSSVKGFSV